MVSELNTNSDKKSLKFILTYIITNLIIGNFTLFLCYRYRPAIMLLRLPYIRHMIDKLKTYRTFYYYLIQKPKNGIKKFSHLKFYKRICNRFSIDPERLTTAFIQNIPISRLMTPLEFYIAYYITNRSSKKELE